MRWWCVMLVWAAGCTSVPSPGTLQGWNSGESQQIGSCSFRLLNASFYHGNAWTMEVEVETKNVGAEAVRCHWEAQLISSGNEPMTESVSGGKTYAPGDGDTLSRVAAEKNSTGLSGGPAEGQWTLMTIQQGQPVIGDSVQFHATPDKARPPG